MTLTEAERKLYIDLCATQGVSQARATMRARWKMNRNPWYSTNRVAIRDELDRIDGKQEETK